MNIAVCVKEVPSATSHRRLDPSTQRLDRSGDSEPNPFDVHALEEAIRIREGGADVGEIVAVCMGPESAQRVLTKALALGADRAVLVTDAALAGSDIAGTAYVLATALAEAGRRARPARPAGRRRRLLRDGRGRRRPHAPPARHPGRRARPRRRQGARQAPGRARLRPDRGAAAGRDLGVRCDQHARGCPRSRRSWAPSASRSRRCRRPTWRSTATASAVPAPAASCARSRRRRPSRRALRIEDAGGDAAEKVVAFLSEKGLI